MLNPSTMTAAQLCGLFDHTNLKPHATRADFETLCREAAENRFAMVAINSAPVKLCHDLLAGTGVHVGAAISFPLGQTTIEVKAFETERALRDGADEIDYVVNLAELKNGNWDYLCREMEEIVSLCRGSAISKVIFENCYLTRDEIVRLAEIARAVGPDFIKTSTGFGASGARAEDVALMKRTVGDGVKVKAAGGIRSWADCLSMIEAGAARIGTSRSLDILREFRAR